MALSANESIKRRIRGRGFEYFYATGNKVGCRRTLARIERLVIPPQWTQVRIHPQPGARVQAEGLDRRQRLQYIYHPRWIAQQQQQKFDKLTDFGSRLPPFRDYCWRCIEAQEWSIERSSALACLLLDRTGIRAGNQQYTQSNDTYGLTTLRRRHLHRDGDSVWLSFNGKHGRQREVIIDDPRLAELVAQSAEKQGYALFRYRANGHWHDVDNDDVNGFIHQHLGDHFSCKDFRTWSASRYALHSLPVIQKTLQQNLQRKWSPTLTRHVAKMLGNTPQICQKYYLHPKLIEAVQLPVLRKSLMNSVDEIINTKRKQNDVILEVEKLILQVIS